MYGMVRQLLRASAICLSLVHTSLCCATGIHVILARGQGAGDHLNELVSIRDLILERIPGSTSVALPYDHGSANKFLAVHDGALLMQKYIRDYVSSCPDSKIAVFGYSLVCHVPRAVWKNAEQYSGNTGCGADDGNPLWNLLSRP